MIHGASRFVLLDAFLACSRSRLPHHRLALATDMRRAELLALRWRDVDLDQAKITVARGADDVGPRFKEPA